MKSIITLFCISYQVENEDESVVPEQNQQGQYEFNVKGGEESKFSLWRRCVAWSRSEKREASQNKHNKRASERFAERTIPTACVRTSERSVWHLGADTRILSSYLNHILCEGTPSYVMSPSSVMLLFDKHWMMKEINLMGMVTMRNEPESEGSCLSWLSLFKVFGYKWLCIPN